MIAALSDTPRAPMAVYAAERLSSGHLLYAKIQSPITPMMGIKLSNAHPLLNQQAIDRVGPTDPRVAPAGDSN